MSFKYVNKHSMLDIGAHQAFCSACEQNRFWLWFVHGGIGDLDAVVDGAYLVCCECGEMKLLEL
jgi:hypothetical protein